MEEMITIALRNNSTGLLDLQMILDKVMNKLSFIIPIYVTINMLSGEK